MTESAAGAEVTDIATRPHLRVVPQGRIDFAAAERAARDLLVAFGLDLDDPTLAGTPARFVRGYAELLSPREFTLTTFPNDEEYDELVLVRDIAFTSMCEHHLLPFTGTAVVGYLPGARVLGLSKLARVVDHFARRPQTQERLTTQVAGWLDDHLGPEGVGVVLTAEHTCMTLRGIASRDATTVTSALRGKLRADARSRSEFLTLARRPGVAGL